MQFFCTIKKKFIAVCLATRGSGDRASTTKGQYRSPGAESQHSAILHLKKKKTFTTIILFLLYILHQNAKSFTQTEHSLCNGRRSYTSTFTKQFLHFQRTW